MKSAFLALITIIVAVESLERIPVEKLLDILKKQATSTLPYNTAEPIKTTPIAYVTTTEPIPANQIAPPESIANPKLNEEDAARQIWDLMEKYRPIWDILIQTIEGFLGGSISMGLYKLFVKFVFPYCKRRFRCCQTADNDI